jgi:hypothetical protein
MNDDFEKRLQRQPLRKIPSDWREQILQGAKSPPHSSFEIRHSFLSTLLWPNPKAWAGLAAAWVVIFALQFASRDPSQRIESVSATSRPVYLMTLKEEQQTLAELMGNNPPPDVEKPRRVSPPPRSDLRISISMA